jgi:hypothetical protein
VAGNGRRYRFYRIMLALMTTALTLTVLISTNIWNPLPVLNDLINRLTRLSDPEPEWTVRLGGKPDIAAVMSGSRVVVASRGFVEGYRTDDGQRAWHRSAYWAFPASSVVVIQQKPEDPDANPDPERGYSVLNPTNGEVWWSDTEAIAVWVYAADIVDLVCPDEEQCTLRNRDPRTGGFLWQIDLPGSARTLRGPNPGLPTVRDPAGWFAPAAAGTAPTLPTVMALPFGDRVHLVDTFAGRLLREVAVPDRQTRVAFIGDRQLFVRAERADSGCRFTVEALDVTSGDSVWREDGFDLDTARGAGCEQRENPIGAGGRLVVTGSDARPMLVEADQAARTWTGPPGAQVLATDGLLAVVLAPDRQSLSVIDAAAPGGRTVWSGELGLDPLAAITPNLVIIRDTDAGRLLALQRGSMRVVLEVKTKVDVIGYGRSGILLTSGRSIGYLPVGGTRAS